MRIWTPGQTELLSSVTSRAAGGRPTVLAITGDAGTGKTSLMEELVRQSRGFAVARAEALEGDISSFSILAQWGAAPPAEGGAGLSGPAAGAQTLRRRVDELTSSGPVLLILDDLHWADPESVQALMWLFRRTSGDRLLVVTASRPLSGAKHQDWRRWTAGHDRCVCVTMSGLSEAEATTLIQRHWPRAGSDVSHRLWVHTAGNPLYLTALLEEHGPAELAGARMLPAPVEYADRLEARMARLPDAGRALLSALAVLGAGWFPLWDVGAVGRVTEISEGAQALVDRGLAQVRTLDGTATMRTAHALIQAAVYQKTPLPTRRMLHRRAAAVVRGESEVLQHQMAASEGYDEPLAEAMSDYAAALYDKRLFRQAAQHHRWSSALTRDPGSRERRWLESLFCSLMAADFAVVHAEAEHVRQATDPARRALVLGTLALWERRRREAIDLLEPPTNTLPLKGEERVRYRLEVLLAWAGIGLGHPTSTIAAALDNAQRLRVYDAGLSGIELVSSGQVRVRMHGAQEILGELAALPDAAPTVPMRATNQLAWRGTLRAQVGLTREAGEDLREVARRVQEGETDFGAGSFHAFLAYTQWLRGDWSHARLNFRVAFDISGPATHPMILALAPLSDITDGRFTEAGQLLERAERDLRQAPWAEACQLFFVTRVIRAHATGSAAEHSTLQRKLEGTPFDPSGFNAAGPLTLVHMVLAAVWARDPALAQERVERLEAIPRAAPWLPAAIQWCKGLICEARGKGGPALAHLQAASDDTANDLPLYRAHMHADQARVAYLLDRRSAEDSRRFAEDLYRQLGARPYIERLTELGPDLQSTGVAEPAYALSDRERDVLTLVVGGMSYVQIARELFITSSTVSYHLGNIYSKTGVESRHQLAELARRTPHALGLAPAAN